MKLIGKDNGHMSDLKFLYSAVDELSNKDEITVTDFLALSAFVTSEKLDLESYQSWAGRRGARVVERRQRLPRSSTEDCG